MTTEEQTDRNGQALFTAAIGNDAWAHAVHYRKPQWVHELASSVALAAVGEDVEYVSLGGTDAEGFDLSGTAFTRSRLIHFTAKAETVTGDAELEVTVRGLKDLVSLGVHTGTHLGAAASETAWPGTPSATLRFRDGFSVEIPAARVQRHEDREPLAALVQRLPLFLG